MANLGLWLVGLNAACVCVSMFQVLGSAKCPLYNNCAGVIHESRARVSAPILRSHVVYRICYDTSAQTHTHAHNLRDSRSMTARPSLCVREPAGGFDTHVSITVHFTLTRHHIFYATATMLRAKRNVCRNSCDIYIPYTIHACGDRKRSDSHTHAHARTHINRV